MAFPVHTALLFLVLPVVWCLAWGYAGAYVARSKNREPWLGAILGIFLGVIGLVILLVLPEVPEQGEAAANAPPPTTRSPLDIVDERYARGEITRDEFEQLKADLA
jgi:uncharacterized membrane protein